MIFKWLVATKDGQQSFGQMEASSRGEVVEFLRRQGHYVVSVDEIKIQSKTYSTFLSFLGKVPAIEKIAFTEHLATMSRAGLSLLEAMDILIEDTTNKKLKNIILELKSGVESGKPLSSTLKKNPLVFSRFYISLVDAGERSGKLDEVLKKLSTQLKKDHALRSKIKGALAYPVVLFTATLGVVFMIVTFVLPKLIDIFSQANIKLPLVTRIILAISGFISSNLILTFLLILGSIFGFIFSFKLQKVKDFYSRFFLKMPKIKKLLQNIQLARFCSTFSSMLSSGISIYESMEITASTLNPVYKKAVISFIEPVEKGVSLSNVFKKRADLFPHMITGMIRVGEKSGDLESLLSEMADFFDEEVDNTFKEVTSLIEPALLIFMGVVIGGIALAVIGPIYQLISKVG